MKLYINEQLIAESLPDIQSDVDIIYDRFFRKDIEDINENRKLKGTHFKKYKTNTGILNSKNAKKAHLIKPCDIYLNYDGNSYIPEYGQINISFTKSAIDFVKGFSGDLDRALIRINRDQRKALKSEFSPHKIKGTIEHELLHWLDDALHNNRIKKMMDKISMMGRKKALRGRNITSHFIEIQAQMGNIRQLKLSLGDDKWDDMEFSEIISIIPSFNFINRKLKNNPDEHKEWLKNVKKRMNREGLLGKKMR